jgi:hypothetical protein
MSYLTGKKGQVAVFVIIAIVIVGGIIAYFYARSASAPVGIPTELAPAFDYYQSCIQSTTRSALDLAGTQGGYTKLPAEQPASYYAPFSSNLDFLGFSVPYWEYVSGNGIVKEQELTSSQVELQIASFVQEQLPIRCHFDDFYSKGWNVNIAAPKVSVQITDNIVQVSVSAATTVTFANQSASKSDYSVSVDSRFGDLLNKAQAVYQKEAQEAFLENYTMDVLDLYAPVDGVEIGCAPKIWKSRDVESAIKQGLNDNIAALQFGKKSSYFNVAVDSGNADIRAMYSQSWPSSLQIDGADGEIMRTDSMGQQAGMGVIGFCYQPYHFVYSLMYPVLFQLSEGNEIFQFPVVAIIKNNVPRQVNLTLAYNDTSDTNLCQYATQDVNVNLFDNAFNPIDGEVSYSCFDQSCSLGETVGGSISGKIPACINGFMEVNAPGYASKSVIFSSHNTSDANIYLDKLYNVSVSLLIDGKNAKGTSVIYLQGAQTATAVIPDNSNVQLSEGFYNVSVYVYGNTSITLPASTNRQCSTVSASGISGFFGQTREQCYDITIPQTKIDQAIIGGGTGEIYLLPEMLQSGKITLSVSSLPVPKNLEDLQTSYALFDTQGVDIVR